MADTKFWNRLTRADIVISLASAAGVGGLMNGAGIRLASQVGWIADQGWAAVVLAGIVVASLFGIMLAAIAAAIVAWRWRKSAAASRPQAAAEIAAPPEVERRVAALERQFAEARDAVLDVTKATKRAADSAERIGPAFDARLASAEAALRAEIGAAARDIREGDAARFENIRKAAEHALDQGRRREEAFKAALGALRDEHGSKFDGLDAKFDEYAGRLGERLGSLVASAQASERRIFDLLRARDAEAELRRLDGEASSLFGKLRQGDGRDYPDATVWHADFLQWKLRVEKFWDVLRRYSESIQQPFAMTDADLVGRNEAPDGALFADPDVRRRYQIMSLVNERHAKLRENAFPFMENLGRPPANPA